MKKSVDLYNNNGIELSNQKMYVGEKVTLTYKGLLVSSGADRVFVHYGYGDDWQENDLAEMIPTDDGFSADIDLKMSGTLNICFRDSAYNWDNNSNENYSFKVTAKKAGGRPRKKAAAV